jgi:hypothetical protein
MPSPEAELSPEERAALLELARAAVRAAFDGRTLRLDPANLPPRLAAPGAAFVTLERHGELRGCIGSLERRRPLAEDVCENACAAAFRDPRFEPLGRAELGDLEIHLSILGPLEPFPVASEAAALAALEPGVDGLVLEAGFHRATFLPAVWEKLPDPRDFLAHLKRKAGLSPHYWSADLRLFRYRVDAFGAPFAAAS